MPSTRDTTNATASPLLLKRSLDQGDQIARDILSIASILAFALFNPDALAAATNSNTLASTPTASTYSKPWPSVDIRPKTRLATEDYLDTLSHWADRCTALRAGVNAGKELRDRREKKNFPGKLANAYSGPGKLETVIEHYQQAVDISKKFRGRSCEGGDLGDLGVSCRDLAQVEKARTYWNNL